MCCTKWTTLWNAHVPDSCEVVGSNMHALLQHVSCTKRVCVASMSWRSVVVCWPVHETHIKRACIASTFGKQPLAAPSRLLVSAPGEADTAVHTCTVGVALSCLPANHMAKFGITLTHVMSSFMISHYGVQARICGGAAHGPA